MHSRLNLVRVYLFLILLFSKTLCASQIAQFKNYNDLLEQYVQPNGNMNSWITSNLGQTDGEVDVESFNFYLGSIIQKIQGTCFLHVTNFHHLSLPQSFSHPMILVHPILALRKSYDIYQKRETAAIFTGGIELGSYSKWMNNSRPEEACMTSNYLDDASPCHRIYKTGFSMASKAWNLEIFLRLLPPLALEELSLNYVHWTNNIVLNAVASEWYFHFYSDYFTKKQHTRRRDLITPSSQAIIYITVILKKTESSLNQLAEFYSNYFHFSKRNYLAAIALFWESRWISAKEKLSPELLKVISENLVWVGQNSFKIIHFPELQKMTISGEVNLPEQIAWKFEWSRRSKYEFSEIFYSCDFQDTLRIRGKIKGKDLIKSYIRLWSLVLLNFTIIVDIGVVCVSHGQRINDMYTLPLAQLAFEEILPRQTEYPADMVDTFQSLRFVTCGVRGKDSLEFGELIGTYDKWTWACLVTSVVLITFGMRCAHRIPMTTIFISMYRSLTEQSDPFPTRLFRNKGSAVVSIIFIFIAIVLSSAYKSDNVLHMIQPREPLLYKRYEHLRSDNFTIYTRAMVDIGGNLLRFRIKALIRNRVVKIPEHLIYFYAVPVFSRSSPLSAVVISEMYQMASTFANEPYYNQLIKILDTSSILPSTLKTVSKLYNISKRLPSFPDVSLFEARQLLYNLQHEDFIRYLGDCKKVAVLLPFFKAIEYLVMLKNRQHKYNTASIGDTGYTDLKIGFYLAGNVPFYIYERLNRMKTSGVWNWRGKVLTSMFNRTMLSHLVTKSTVSAASVEGQILVIFAVYVGGIALAIFIFAVEGIRFEMLIKIIATLANFFRSCGRIFITKCKKACRYVAALSFLPLIRMLHAVFYKNVTARITGFVGRLTVSFRGTQNPASREQLSLTVATSQVTNFN